LINKKIEVDSSGEEYRDMRQISQKYSKSRAIPKAEQIE
jgi:hypothetical protein